MTKDGELALRRRKASSFFVALRLGIMRVGSKEQAGRKPRGLKRVARVAVARPVAAGLTRLRRVKRAMRVPSLPFVSDALRRSGAGTVEGLTPEAAQYARRNFRFGVLNGILFTLVDGLLSPTLVLAWFVSRLGGANVLVGMLPAIL